MQQIDQDARRHSHLYEVKPMSRWWLAIAVFAVLLGVSANGFFDWVSWALIGIGIMTGFFILLIFPKRWLSRLD